MTNSSKSTWNVNALLFTYSNQWILSSTVTFHGISPVLPDTLNKCYEYPILVRDGAVAPNTELTIHSFSRTRFSFRQFLTAVKLPNISRFFQISGHAVSCRFTTSQTAVHAAATVNYDTSSSCLATSNDSNSTHCGPQTWRC